MTHALPFRCTAHVRQPALTLGIWGGRIAVAAQGLVSGGFAAGVVFLLVERLTQDGSTVAIVLAAAGALIGSLLGPLAIYVLGDGTAWDLATTPTETRMGYADVNADGLVLSSTERLRLDELRVESLSATTIDLATPRFGGLKIRLRCGRERVERLRELFEVGAGV